MKFWASAGRAKHQAINIILRVLATLTEQTLTKQLTEIQDE
jgi:hypothetical protein